MEGVFSIWKSREPALWLVTGKEKNGVRSLIKMIHCLIVAETEDAELVKKQIDRWVNAGKRKVYCTCDKTPERAMRMLKKHGAEFDLIVFREKEGVMEMESFVNQARVIHKDFPLLFFLILTGMPYVRTMNHFLPYISIYSMPVSPSEFKELFHAYHTLLDDAVSPRKRRIGLRTKDGVQYVDYRSILYMKRRKQGADVVTLHGSLFCRVRLELILDDFQLDFCRCGYSCAVNGMYIERVTANSVYLKSGEILPISRSYKPVVNDFLNRNVFL